MVSDSYSTTFLNFAYSFMVSSFCNRSASRCIALAGGPVSSICGANRDFSSFYVVLPAYVLGILIMEELLASRAGSASI